MPSKAMKQPQASNVPPALAGLVIVSLSDGGQSYGLYRVKQADSRTMVLVKGPISFPVGTHLDVEDYQYDIPNPASFSERATVVESGKEGIRLVW